MVCAPRCLRICGAGWSRRIINSAKLLSSRSTTLNRGLSRLMRLDSSSSASVSVAVVTNSMCRVRLTIRAMRWVWNRPWAYCITRFFRLRALPTYRHAPSSPYIR